MCDRLHKLHMDNMPTRTATCWRCEVRDDHRHYREGDQRDGRHNRFKRFSSETSKATVKQTSHPPLSQDFAVTPQSCILPLLHGWDVGSSSASPTHLSLETRSQASEEAAGATEQGTGPDLGPSLWDLKVCVDQQCGVLELLCNVSLNQENVPVLWKTCSSPK